MKRFLLFIVIFLVAGSLFAQRYQVKEKFISQKHKHFFNVIADEPIGSKAPLFPSTTVSSTVSKDPNQVQIIDLGQSGNAFGMSGSARTTLWADNNLNAVAFVHRMAAGGVYGANGNSRIAFDRSKDGGATWWNNVQIYEPTGPGSTYPQNAGRYPQGGIYNPTGNTNADNSYVHYFIPTLDATNGTSWGGYGYGVRKYDTTAAFTQHNITSHGAYRQNVPDAFTISPNRTAWVVDPSVVGGIGTAYTDSLLISKGTYNSGINDYEYTQTLLYAPSDKYIADSKIAFGPDGNTGYISLISHHSFVFDPDSSFYPILYKTTNGGDSWDGPIPVKLWGPGGIAVIKNYVTDSMLNLFFTPPIPVRDSITYTTAWEHDLAVDANGNPHIAVVVGIGGGKWDIYTPRDYIAMFDIFSPDGGNTWNARYLDSLKEFTVDLPGTSVITDYNRPQISRTMDGTKLFYSWADTEDPNAADLMSPNIYCQGYNLTNGQGNYTKNVTKFTTAYSVAYLFVASHYIFETGTDYNIPFVYNELDATNNANPVQFKYIHNFNIPYEELLSVPAIEKPVNSVSGNYPNPCHGTTQFEVKLAAPSRVGVSVTNVLGQEVKTLPGQPYTTGTHTLTLDVSSLPSGVYICNVKIQQENHSFRMIVR
ncbi:MAG: T9SS type A sorting domain-containing protein [Bacteroidetes bacterium]|nr:T9SS type A sorting domain-containing protein [Bacteroidota bacterium]